VASGGKRPAGSRGYPGAAVAHLRHGNVPRVLQDKVPVPRPGRDSFQPALTSRDDLKREQCPRTPKEEAGCKAALQMQAESTAKNGCDSRR
jgi:hypothetical protein